MIGIREYDVLSQGSCIILQRGLDVHDKTILKFKDSIHDPNEEVKCWRNLWRFQLGQMITDGFTEERGYNLGLKG